MFLEQKKDELRRWDGEEWMNEIKWFTTKETADKPGPEHFDGPRILALGVDVQSHRGIACLEGEAAEVGDEDDNLVLGRTVQGGQAAFAHEHRG